MNVKYIVNKEYHTVQIGHKVGEFSIFFDGYGLGIETPMMRTERPIIYDNDSARIGLDFLQSDLAIIEYFKTLVRAGVIRNRTEASEAKRLFEKSFTKGFIGGEYSRNCMHKH